MGASDSRERVHLNGISVYPSSVVSADDPFRQRLHLAIGMFDGVHLGHQAVIRQAVEAARVDPGSRAAVLTFDPHPSRVLFPERATELLMSLSGRTRKMLSLGLDLVFVRQFTRAYSQIDAAAFIPELMAVFPGLASLHVGANFRFGSNRSGSVDTLCSHGTDAGLAVQVVDPKIVGGKPVSSSRIRKLLAAGEIEGVNALLGYPYTVSGKVIQGRQLGRRIGFPTLNIPWHPEACPRYGVYKAWLIFGSKTTPLSGVANYGLKPTVGKEDRPVLEVHLMGPGTIPDEDGRVHVALTHFLRPEQSFPTIDALREQITRDVQEARSIEDQDLDFSSIGI